MNLLDFFAHRRSWRQFYNLIGRLPSWGHYKAALSADEDYARLLCDMEDEGVALPPAPETTEGYSPVIARLDMIADRVMAVRTAVQANYTKEHQEPTFEPIERPTTALERERDRRAVTVLHEVDALVRGGGLGIVLEAAE